MRPIRLITLLLATPLLGAAPASQPAPRSPSVVQVGPNDPYLHKPSHFLFPDKLGAFKRRQVYRVDAAGDDVTVAYRDPDLKIIVTISVYPTLDVPPARHFEAVKQAFLRLHPKAKVTVQGAWSVRQLDPDNDPDAARQAEGLRALYEYIGPFDGVEQDLTTETYLVPLGRHFARYRLTYPTADAKAARGRAQRFLEVLRLPPARE